MPFVTKSLIRPHGQPLVRLGVPLLDEYLEFLSGRCRPNTVLAVAYDLKVFFTVVGRSPERVRPADVLGFMTAQRTQLDRRRADAGRRRSSRRVLADAAASPVECVGAVRVLARAR